MNRQHRAIRPTEIRAVEDQPGQFIARVLTYNTVDEYGTSFKPGVFRESLSQRLPRIVWQHDWREPLGRYVDYQDTDEYLDLKGQFDDFDAVPRARQAYAQLMSGTIDQFSVGFLPTRTSTDEDGRLTFEAGTLDEVSLVIVGAVPGTQLLAVRARPVIVRAPDPKVPVQTATDLLLKLYQGEIDLADALQEIKAQAQVPEEEDKGDGGDEPDKPGDPDPGEGASEDAPEPDPDGVAAGEGDEPLPETGGEADDPDGGDGLGEGLDAGDDLDSLIDAALEVAGHRSGRHL